MLDACHLDTPIACRPRQSGSMPAGQAQQPHFITVPSCARELRILMEAMSTLRAAVKPYFAIIPGVSKWAAQQRLGATLRMLLGSTICMGTSGNGAPIGSHRACQAAASPIRRALPPAHGTCSVAGVGIITGFTAGPRTATGKIQPRNTLSLVSESS